MKALKGYLNLINCRFKKNDICTEIIKKSMKYKLQKKKVKWNISVTFFNKIKNEKVVVASELFKKISALRIGGILYND